jgi:predicted patatin/cPLA2 family phospholipase
MPVVSRPVCIGGRRYLDGGIADSIPLPKMQSLGFERNVVVLTQPAGYRKGPARLWPFRPWLRGLPAVEAALARRSDEYNRAVDFVEAEEKKGATFVFRPPAKLPIGRLSRSRRAIQAAYDIGRETAMRSQTALRDWLAVRPPEPKKAEPMRFSSAERP